MFQNKYNAKQAGKAAEKQALAKGLSAKDAARAGRRVAAQHEQRANEWVRKNVGLD